MMMHADELEGFGLQQLFIMGVSKNRGTPKWMVYIAKPH